MFSSSKVKNLPVRLIAIAVLCAWTQVASASFEFEFSFSNVTGNVNGEVTGRILGLVDNTANQPATSILIESYPDGLNGEFNTNNDPVTWGIFLNSFTVENGEIVAAAFGAQDLNGVLDTFCINYPPSSCIGNSSVLHLDNGQTQVSNNDAFAGVTFSSNRPSAPVPTLSEWTLVLLILSMAMVGFIGLRRRLN